MGTNYYIVSEPCKTCHHEPDRLHIGKSSAGWCFGLHVTDEFKTLEDWRSKIESGAKIQDEYGDLKTPDEMMAVIISRDVRTDWQERDWQGMGYTNETDFHMRNHSERGPNRLLRHAIDGRHCIGHGEGTWDYIIGEFS